MGPKHGGLAAYVNVNEFKKPRRFAFAADQAGRPSVDQHDYLPQLMQCWFRANNIERFKPRERFVVGRDLIARWSKIPGVDALAYIRAKIEESRLNDMHPICGGTRGSTADDSYPPVEQGLFGLNEVRAIEAEELIEVVHLLDAKPSLAGRDQAATRQRQERRYRMCIEDELPMPKDDYAHLPRGIGRLAKQEGITRQAFAQDVKAHIRYLMGK